MIITPADCIAIVLNSSRFVIYIYIYIQYALCLKTAVTSGVKKEEKEEKKGLSFNL